MKTAILMAAFSALTGFAANANIPLANNMTCAQAQAYYAANGRVYVETRMGDIVPVYGDNRDCTWAESVYPVWVRTTDTNSCHVADRCEYDGSENN